MWMSGRRQQHERRSSCCERKQPGLHSGASVPRATLPTMRAALPTMRYVVDLHLMPRPGLRRRASGAHREGRVRVGPRVPSEGFLVRRRVFIARKNRLQAPPAVRLEAVHSLGQGLKGCDTCGHTHAGWTGRCCRKGVDAAFRCQDMEVRGFDPKAFLLKYPDASHGRDAKLTNASADRTKTQRKGQSEEGLWGKQPRLLLCERYELLADLTSGVVGSLTHSRGCWWCSSQSLRIRRGSSAR